MQSVYSFDNIWRYVIGHGFTHVLLIMGFISLSVFSDISTRPYFILMPLFYWAIYRPTFMPVFFIFGIGLIYDLVIGFPVGLHSILFVVYFLTVQTQRLFLLGQGYHVSWIGFGVSCLAVLMMEYIFFSIKTGTILNFAPVMSAFLLSALFYPLISTLLILINRLLPIASQTSYAVD